MLVGLSDHSIGVDAGFLSVALGAVAVEKHFTPSREIGGPDASFSATPEEFFALRQKLDLATSMLGEVSDDRSAFEDQSRGLRKSIYFVNDLKKGDQLTRGDVKVIRPGHGLHPRYFNDLDGAKLTRDVTYGEPVLKSDVNHSFDAEWFTSSDFRLQEIIPTSEQINILFELLKNRNQSTNISHEKQPSFKQHKEFVTSNPYRGWWLIYDEKRDDVCLGSVYVGNDNSVGLHIALDRVAFSAEHFVEKLKCARKPLRPVKSKIGRDYFFNVSPNNYSLIQWLERSYFVEIQRSFFR